jgi:hypothetical protein
MTTKTKVDPGAKLAELEKALVKAREEAAEVGVRLRAQQSRYRDLETTLATLARREPGEFNEDGSPRGDDAKKLQAELSKLQASRLPDLVAGRQEQVHIAETEITKHIGVHAEALARAEFEGRGKAATEKIKRGAALIAEGHSEYVASAQRQMQICIANTGLDGQDVLSDPRAAEVAHLAGGLGDLAAPRSQSLTPTDWAPKVRVRSGAFVPEGRAHPDDLADVEQPQRLEA